MRLPLFRRAMRNPQPQRDTMNSQKLHAPSGATVVVSVTPGHKYQLDFDMAEATLARAGHDLVAHFSDGGRLTLSGFFPSHPGYPLPVLQFANGREISSYCSLTGMDPLSTHADAAEAPRPREDQDAPDAPVLLLDGHVLRGLEGLFDYPAESDREALLTPAGYASPVGASGADVRIDAALAALTAGGDPATTGKALATVITLISSATEQPETPDFGRDFREISNEAARGAFLQSR